MNREKKILFAALSVFICEYFQLVLFEINTKNIATFHFNI